MAVGTSFHLDQWVRVTGHCLLDGRRFRNRIGRVFLTSATYFVDVEFRPGAVAQHQDAYWGRLHATDVTPAVPTRQQEERWLIHELSR